MEKRVVCFIFLNAQGRSDKVGKFYVGTVLFNMPLFYFHLFQVNFCKTADKDLQLVNSDFDGSTWTLTHFSRLLCPLVKLLPCTLRHYVGNTRFSVFRCLLDATKRTWTSFLKLLTWCRRLACSRYNQLLYYLKTRHLYILNFKTSEVGGCSYQTLLFKWDVTDMVFPSEII